METIPNGVQQGHDRLSLVGSHGHNSKFFETRTPRTYATHCNQFLFKNRTFTHDTTTNIDMVIIGLIINILLGYPW